MRLGVKLKPHHRSLEALPGAPGVKPLKDFEEDPFLTSDLTWDDHPQSNVHTVGGRETRSRKTAGRSVPSTR